MNPAKRKRRYSPQQKLEILLTGLSGSSPGARGGCAKESGIVERINPEVMSCGIYPILS